MSGSGHLQFQHRDLVITGTEGNPRVLGPADRQSDQTGRPTAAEWARRDAAVVWHGFTQMSVYEDSAPVIVERGEGNYLYDTDGRRYLDAISSLWVITLGHADPDLNRAARDQLDRISHKISSIPELRRRRMSPDIAAKPARGRCPGLMFPRLWPCKSATSSKPFGVTSSAA